MPSNAVNLLISRRLMIKASGQRLPRNRRVPHPLQPTGLEREYYFDILALIAPLRKQVEEILIPVIPAIIRMHAEEMRVDSARLDAVIGYSQLITRSISDVRVAISKQITVETISDRADSMARRVSVFNQAQINRQFQSVLGINPLMSERWLEPLVSSFTEKNVALIKSISNDCLNKIEGLVRNTVERGIGTGKLESQIYAEYGGMIHNQLEMTHSRAHLIARDQIAKYNGSLTELRQKSAGVTKYIWSTSKDERVRQLHQELDGKTFSWDDPPVSGTSGEKLPPGLAINCRCCALPILEEFL